jgi:hypothetical protein
MFGEIFSPGEKSKLWLKIEGGGEINEKVCSGDFIVGFGSGVGRVPLVASPPP